MNLDAKTMVEHPSHYRSGKYECIDVMRDVFGDEAVENFCLLNSFKYLYRCRYKNSYKDDLRKTKRYIEMILESGEDCGSQQESDPIDTPKDAPRGWIKLKTIKGVTYINVSKIVGVDLPDPADVSNGVAATVHTVGAEDDPWLVYDSVEEVMEKIEKA